MLELPKKIELVENMTYILQCTLVSGSKPVTFEWFKDNEKISDNDNGVKIENLQAISTLSFSEVRRGHEGTYQCLVSSPFGQDSSETRIMINGK